MKEIFQYSLITKGGSEIKQRKAVHGGKWPNVLSILHPSTITERKGKSPFYSVTITLISFILNVYFRVICIRKQERDIKP